MMLGSSLASIREESTPVESVMSAFSLCFCLACSWVNPRLMYSSSLSNWVRKSLVKSMILLRVSSFWFSRQGPCMLSWRKLSRLNPSSKHWRLMNFRKFPNLRVLSLMRLTCMEKVVQSCSRRQFCMGRKWPSQKSCSSR